MPLACTVGILDPPNSVAGSPPASDGASYGVDRAPRSHFPHGRIGHFDDAGRPAAVPGWRCSFGPAGPAGAGGQARDVSQVPRGRSDLVTTQRAWDEGMGSP